ncbi:MAG: stage V sporulation protein AC [Clostridia bacterium]|nr:stage V sporulation protein AC [Clostridia bacterium]MBQ6859600.1 stage V sporulation protein AC [Clostridia bacterium]MBQ7053443.1 stage V sporulation protein AC [Clostridia bacterium]
MGVGNPQSKRTIERYAQLVARLAPKSEIGKGLLRAFWVGGLICSIGQGISDFYGNVLLLGVESASTATSITLIAIAALLTGIGVYDKIGKYAGAGSIVPITGFANSVVAPAMEFRREGLVMGVGAKLFTLAGPVLVYGISSSIVVGLAAYLMEWL